MRDRVRATPGSRHVYRMFVAVLGTAVTVGGLVLVPLPGPGWIIVFVGLAILASEFVWAQRLLDFGRGKLQSWTRWMMRQALWVRVMVGLVTAAFVGGVLYLLLLWQGVPSWFLEVAPAWLPLPGR